MKNYIGISRDHSGSMSGITTAAMRDYNQLIQDINTASKSEGIDTVVDVVECGRKSARYGAENRMVVVNSSANALKPITSYPADGGGHRYLIQLEC